LAEFYGAPGGDAARQGGFRVAILTLGVAAVLVVYLGLTIVGLRPAEQGSHGFTIAGVVFLLGVVSVLRKERGALGAAAAVVALGSAGFVLFSYAFAYTITWLMHVFMPD
jgi:hypothetical protein